MNLYREQRRARYVPTLWDKHHAFIGGLLYAVVAAFVGIEVIIMYGTRWPR
jgi:23S rRNA maturation-related 3'-5' exoribonuclease YhaM